MSDFRYLTFDCYGTLIDWRTGIQRHLGAALGNVRLPRGETLLTLYVKMEAEEEEKYRSYRRVLRDTAMKIAKKLDLDMDADAAESFAASVPSWPPFEDTVKSLRKLGSLGYQRHILSNVDTDILEETIRRNDLEVDGFVTAEEVHSYKPSFGHWRRFLRKTGAKKKEVLHVAQSIFHDIRPAKELGMQAAWVNRYREALPRDVAPWMISDDLRHLASILS